MAEGLRSWLQSRTPGSGNWAEKLGSHKAQRTVDAMEGNTPAPAPATPPAGLDPKSKTGPAGVRGSLGTPEALAAGGGLLASTGNGLRSAAGKVGDFFKNLSARGVGAAAGQTVNAAEAGVEAAKAAGADIKAGFNQTRGLSASVQAEQAKRAGMASVEQLAASGKPGFGPQIPRGIQFARKAVGALGRASPWVLAGTAGAGALGEASDQMGQPGLAAASMDTDAGPENPLEPGIRTQSRLGRIQGMMQAGLRAIDPRNLIPDDPFGEKSPLDRRGPDFGKPPAGTGFRPEAAGAATATPGAAPIEAPDASGRGTVTNNQTGATQVIGGPKIMGQTFLGREGMSQQDQAAFEVARIQAQIDANRAEASPEAGGTGISLGGLRGTPVSTGGGSRTPIQSAFDGLANLNAYGAESRMKKNEADVGLRKATLLNDVAKANLTAGQKQQEIDIKRAEFGTKLRTENETRVNAQLDRAAAELTGGMKPSGGVFGDAAETSDQYKVRKEQDAAKFRNSVDYSLRQSGLNVADLKNEQVQGFRDAHKLKTAMEKARSGAGQSIRDYFGNKRFDSDDLRSYTPVKAVKANDGGFLIHFANGNTAKVDDLQNGKFNWFGPNEPVDADIAAILKPHIDKAKQGKK